MKHKLFYSLLIMFASANILFAKDGGTIISYKNVDIGGLYYNIDTITNTAQVTSKQSGGYNEGSTITIANIPESVIYRGRTYAVTSIDRCAFRHCYSLTSVTIPSSITSIGWDAFRFCNQLTSVTIPSSVTSIESSLFEGCSSLTSAIILANIPCIEYSTFSGCSSLTSVTIPNSVTRIGGSAFAGCYSLYSLTIPNTVTTIDTNAFSGVINVNYSGSATGSPWGALSVNSNVYVEGCLVYEDEGKTILKACLKSATGTINIPNSVIQIGDGAFNWCSDITAITIPNSVTSIGNSAFAGCFGLTSLTIPNSVKNIGNYAFGECYNLTSLTIPNGITCINDGVFSGCSNLSSITIPDSVTSIGNNAFGFCAKLSSLTIPNTVTTIGDQAFSGCSNLSSITIPNNVTSIGSNAFWYCSKLSSLTIPSSVTHIGESPLLGCSNLSSIIVENDNSVYDSRNNCNALIETSTNSLICGCKNSTIPNGITSIGDNAFNECRDLTAVVVPNSVTSIGNSAFTRCVDLKTITLGNNVNHIGGHAFSGCSGLTSIILPTGLTDIGDYTFYQCKNLTSIVIPQSVTSIGNRAFNECYALSNVTIPEGVDSIGSYAFGTCSKLTSINIPKSVKSIGSYAFYNCSSLKSVHITDLVAWCAISFEDNVANPLNYAHNLYLNNKIIAKLVIPNSVTNIVKCAFCGCSASSVVISDSVKSIGDYAFYNCSQLQSIVIPKSVTSIGREAFIYCSKLKTFEFRNPTPPSLGYNIYYNTTLQTIYVPCGAIDIYASRLPTYSSKIQLKPFPIITIYPSDHGYVEYPTRSCEDTILTAIPDSGYHFVQWNDGVSINPRPIELTKDTSFSAVFAINRYSLQVVCDSLQGDIHGDTGMYNHASIHSFEAVPKYGYHFVQWSDSVTDNPRTISLMQDTVFLAVFAKNPVIHIAYDKTMGYISGDTTTQAGIIMDSVTFSAIPNYSYHFVQWSDSVIENPRTIYLSRDTTFTAVFAQNPKVHYYYDNVMGCVSGDTITPTGIAADSITFFATPNYGYHFVQWSDRQTNNPRTIYLSKDTTFTAEFAKNTYTITTAINDSVRGQVFGDTTVIYLDTVTIAATANYGYHFALWSDGDTLNPRVITVTMDKTYKAIFEKNVYTIIKKCNSVEGSILGVTSANYLDNVPLTATPNYGYHFTQWSDGVTDNPRTICLTKDTVFSAEFAPYIYALRTESSNPVWGITAGDTLAPYLTKVEISATPFYGYYFAGWSDGNHQNPRSMYLRGDTTFTAIFKKMDYAVTIIADSVMGKVTCASRAYYLDTLTVIATAYHGYHFVQWSDSVTDNPRTFVLTRDTAFVAEFAQTFAGQCGDSLYWAFNKDSLVFSGSGDMYSYVPVNLPWSLLIDQTQYIEFAPEMTSISAFAFQNMENLRKLNLSAKIFTIGDFAFDNCTSLDNVTIPNSVISLGASAFHGCTKIDTLIIGTGVQTITNQFRGCTGLRYVQFGKNIHSLDYGSFYDARQLIFIVCHPSLPPLAYPDEVGKERSFYNMNAQVLIPCDNFDAYQYDALWGSFNLKCLSSNSGTAVDGQVIVVPGDADATFTWPTDGSADTYNLEITKDSATFCSLIFDSEGRLLGIAFAPSANGQQPHMPAATMTTKGMSFQVTGLDYASQYRFSFETKDDKTQTLFAYTGGFHTNGTNGETPEGVEDINASAPAQKILLDGKIYILRGDKTYTLQGQEIK